MALLRRSGPAALLALLLLGACDSDAANLAKEITDARGDCNQEKLKASDSVCVEMMQKYATIGTSAIETYIGAVKSMDQALQRMPPANFDTAGFGHAFTPASAADSLGARTSRYPGPAGSAAGSREGYGAAYDPRDPQYGSPTDPRYSDPRYADPQSAGPGYSDPRDQDPRYQDPQYQDPRYQGPRYQDPRGPDPRDRGPQYSAPRYPDGNNPDPRDLSRGDADRRRASPRAAPPARGLLLPPEQRLDRPWLRAPEDAERQESRGTRTRAERPDDYLPSRPLSADTMGPEEEGRPRTRRPEGY
jgi:hypothetical protein